MTRWEDGGDEGNREHACPMCGLTATIKEREEPNFCIECLPNLAPMFLYNKETSSEDICIGAEPRKEYAAKGADRYSRLPLDASDDAGAKESGEHMMKQQEEEPVE